LPARASVILRSGTATARFTGQVIEALSRNIPVALRVTELGRKPEAPDCFTRLCKTLARDIATAGYSAAAIDLTIDANMLQPGYAWERRLQYLGRGNVNFVLDEQTPSNAKLVLALWHLRNVPQVRFAFWPLTSSACPLLSAERALHVLPEIALQVPAQSAWSLARFDVSHYVSCNGATDLDAIRRDIAQLIDAADALHDRVRWPSAAMQQDAWFNRRIALQLTGLAGVVERCGYNPRCHATLARLQVLVAGIREAVLERSRRLAARSETLPAIAASSPFLGMTDGPQRRSFEKRWLRAVRRSGTRHRNLLVLSPWSLFPAKNADPAYANLLPLLALADACLFRRKCSIGSWNVNDFNKFLGRACAALRTVHADYVVAERL
jgi:hypothetical protein